MPDGAGLCALCATTLADILRTVPDLLDELLVTMSRQDRLTAGGGHRGKFAETPLPVNLAVAAVVGRLSDELNIWAAELVETHGFDVANPPRRVAHMGPIGPVLQPTTPAVDLARHAALWLADHVRHLRAHPDVAEAHRRITATVDAAVHAIDRHESNLFIGPCPECGANLYAARDASATKCPQCRAHVADVADRWDMALHRLRGYPATAAELAGSIGELYGITVNRVTISQWYARGEIHLVDEVPLGEHGGRMAPRFRIGEVLDRAKTMRRRAG